METKHTPGPWTLAHFADPSIQCECGYVFGDADRMVAVCAIHYRAWNNPSSDNAPKPEAMANARLIAAAPEMLAALKNIENDDRHIPASVWRLIQDAIAKAEGR